MLTPKKRSPEDVLRSSWPRGMRLAYFPSFLQERDIAGRRSAVIGGFSADSAFAYYVSPLQPCFRKSIERSVLLRRFLSGITSLSISIVCGFTGRRCAERNESPLGECRVTCPGPLFQSFKIRFACCRVQTIFIITFYLFCAVLVNHLLIATHNAAFPSVISTQTVIFVRSTYSSLDQGTTIR